MLKNFQICYATLHNDFGLYIFMNNSVLCSSLCLRKVSNAC